METTSPPRARRRLDVCAVALFLGAILAPTVDQFVRSDEARGPAPELRVPEPRPHFPWPGKGLRSFPAKYEKFYSDSFGLRDVFLRWNSLEKLYVFDTAPSPQLLVGKDRWIFYRGDHSVEALRGLLPMKTDELEDWKAQLELRQKSLESRGIRYFFGIVPNKETIYPEFLPESVNRVGPTRLDTFVPWMRAHSSVPIIDMRPEFFAAKQADKPGEYLYNRHGTHWDGRGSVAAYDAILHAVRALEPDVPWLGPDDWKWQHVDRCTDTWASAMYIPDVLVQDARFPERAGGHTWDFVSQRKGPPRVTHVQNRAPGMRSTLFFHDSFGPSLTMLLGESFSPLYMYWDRYDPHVVAEVMPKLVVEVYVERNLVYPPPGPGDDPERYVIRPIFDSLEHVLSKIDADWTKLFVPVDATPVEILRESTGEAVRFERRTSTHGLMSPEITMPADGDVFGRVDIECATPFVLDVYWKPASATEFKRADCIGVEAGKGRSTVNFRLSPAAGPTRLLLRPRESGSLVTLRSFEVRSALAP